MYRGSSGIEALYTYIYVVYREGMVIRGLHPPARRIFYFYVGGAERESACKASSVS